MKAIYLLLLLVGFSYSQIETLLSVPDTSSLKTMSVGLGGAMFLRGYSSSTNNGAGIYIVIDSAYAEGIQAFDHPTRGYQWYLMSNQTLNDSSVAGSKIQSATINTSNLADSSITSAKIASGSVEIGQVATSVKNELIPIVADTTALKATSGATYKQVYVSEISSGAGVGGGKFVYKSSGYTVDKGAVFAASGGGYYVRTDVVDGKPINIKWYGARGDGITQDSLAISNALLAAKVFKQELKIPAGNFLVNGPIDIPNTGISPSSIAIKGEGQGRSKITMNNDAPFLRQLFYQFSHTFTISDFSIVGVGSSTSTTAGVQIDSTHRGAIKRIRVEGFKYGLLTKQANGMLIEGNRFINNWAGIWLTISSNEVTLLNNYSNQNDSIDVFVAGSSKGTNLIGGGYGNTPYCIYLENGARMNILGGNYEIPGKAVVYMEDNTKVFASGLRIDFSGTSNSYVANIGNTSNLAIGISAKSTASTGSKADVYMRGTSGNVFALAGDVICYNATYGQTFRTFPGAQYKNTSQVAASSTDTTRRGELNYVYRRNEVNSDDIVFWQSVNDTTVVPAYLTDGWDWRVSLTGASHARTWRLRHFAGYKNFTSSAGDSSEITINVGTKYETLYSAIGISELTAGGVFDSYVTIKSVDNTTGNIIFLVWHKANTGGGVNMKLRYNILIKANTW